MNTQQHFFQDSLLTSCPMTAYSVSCWYLQECRNVNCPSN